LPPQSLIGLDQLALAGVRYARGVRLRPDRPLGLAPATVLDYRELARRKLPRQLFDYIDGGAYEEATLRSNVADLERLLLRQVVMRDVSHRDPSVEVLGQKLALPIILAPVGLGGMFARRAEVQAARAAEKAGVPFIESTVSICSIEEVAGATSTPPWFQLYVMRDRGYAEELMARARAVKAPVLVLTIDLAVVGARQRDIRNAMGGGVPTWAKLARGLDLVSHPRWVRDVPIKGQPLTFGNLEKAVPGARSPDAFRSWVDAQFDPSVTWDDIAWVREHWDGRLVVKGVLDPEDARRAVEVGVDGVVVSNHGGRQLDAVPSTVRALPAIADMIGDRAEVLVDGGVRTGLDVVKMMALGAKAVLIGRAWAWAVAARGEPGVRHVLRVMKADIDVALGLTGQTSIARINRSALYTQ
jgi:L-lactate dehydrogenase (cytochrome)